MTGLRMKSKTKTEVAIIQMAIIGIQNVQNGTWVIEGNFHPGALGMRDLVLRSSQCVIKSLDVSDA